MGVSTHSIEVNASVRAVYDQWTQFEEFPHFMEGVEDPPGRRKETFLEGKDRRKGQGTTASLRILMCARVSFQKVDWPTAKTCETCITLGSAPIQGSATTAQSAKSFTEADKRNFAGFAGFGIRPT